MTKALTITPKISHTYNTAAKTTRAAAEFANIAPKPKTAKATRGLVGGIIDACKAIAQKIAKSPESAVTQISKGGNFPSHKDPAALIMKAVKG